MSQKLKQAFSLFISTTLLLSQSGIPTYAVNVDSNLPETPTQHTTSDQSDDSNKQEQSPEDDSTTNQEQSNEDDSTINQNQSIEDDDVIDQDQIIEDNDIEQEEIGLFAAVNPKVVYTQATKSNSDKSGNGSRSNPYNRFEDAVANVEDGGTIIIKSGQDAFLNTQDEYGKIPFIIDKDITIRSEDESTMASLVVRAGGIILQGNVTFKNIRFDFANKLHDSIFANGYHLGVINCERGSGSREVDFFAGSLYDKNTSNLTQGYIYDEHSNPHLVTPRVGNDASILLETTNQSIHSQFGKVFAGSMNGDFTGNVNITIRDGGNLDFVSPHSSGAEEADPGHMFDLTEPAPPQEKPDEYTVNGTVNLYIKNHQTNIYGAGATNSHVTISTEYPISNFSIEDISSITVKEGTIIPDSISWKNTAGNLTLSSSNSELNLSQIKDFTVNDFNGSGRITLQTEGHLTINGNITGETTFQTVGGAIDNSYSGPVINQHIYISSLLDKGNDTSFKFTPAFGPQSHYKLTKESNKWKIEEDINKPALPDKLTELKFNVDKSDLTYIPNGLTELVEIPFTLEPSLDSALYITDLPFELFISSKRLSPSQGVDGEWIDYDLKLEFVLSEDTSGNHVLAAFPHMDPDSTEELVLQPGTHEILLSLPTYNLSTSTLLNVRVKSDKDEDTPNHSKTDFTIKKDNVEVQNASFGEQITITATAQKSNNTTQTFALQNEVDFIVNGKVIRKASIDKNSTKVEITLDITEENGFHSGTNNIKVLFGGSDTLIGSSQEKEFIVNKITPNMKLSSNIETIYDGKPHPLTATISNLKDVQPTIYYYTDSNYTTGETTNPPINVGTYYVKAILPESDSYYATEDTGIVKITQTTPNIILSGTAINKANQTNDLKINAEMLFPQNGSTPIGQIVLECTDAQNRKQTVTKDLSYGTTSHTFENLDYGKYTITASYIPQINGITDINYDSIGSITKTFEIINNFVPVTSIELVSPELLLYKDTSNIVLPFTITPDNASIQSVTWESSDPNIISINPRTGQLEVKQSGNVVITVRTNDGGYSHSSQVSVLENTGNIHPVDSISLDATNIILDLNSTSSQKVTSTISPLDATTTDVIWKSKDDDIATVDDLGNITAKAVGRTKILAVTKDGAKVTTCDVQVIDSQQSVIKVTGITLSENHLTLEKEQRKMLTPTITPLDASDKGISWTSSHPDVAEVTEAGTVIAKSIGSATITATALDGSGVTATSTVTVIDVPTPPDEIAVTSITLDKPTFSLLKGNSAPLIATIAPINATNKNVVWKSDDESIATVTPNGIVTAKSAGTTTITVTALGGNNITATSKVTVTENTTPPEKVPVTGVKLDRTKMTLRQGRKSSLTATVAPYNATNKEVTWKSSNPSIVSVDQDGNITAHAKGYTTITVTTKDGGFTASCDITVTSYNNSNSDNSSGGSGSNSSNSNNNNNTSTHKEEQTPVTPKPDESTPETTPNQPTPTITQFQDVTDNWAKNDIQFVIERGLFQGLSETTFGVNSPMTRGMVVTVLHRLANTPQVGSATFSDVKADTFYADAVSWAATLGIVSGVGSGQFAPNQSVTREQLAVMFYQYAKILGLTSEDTLTKESSFKDSNQISNWSKDAIQWAVDEGIILGNPDGTLNPKGVATRAQVASITKRFVGLTEKLQ